MAEHASFPDEALDVLQRSAFSYFLKEVHPATGLVRDKTTTASPASIAAVGLALTCYPVGVERGWLAREEAMDRVVTTLRFFAASRQSEEPDATGYKGFFYHFLDMRTGRRVWRCELSTIDTALLIAGMLTAAQYFAPDGAVGAEIGALAESLYARIDWRWATNGDATITQGWQPERGFFPSRWGGYDGGLLLYLLALGAPQRPLPKESYAAWTASYRWRKTYGIEYLYAGPLFTHQLAHVWVDFRGIQDAFMRERSIDYFENSRRATYGQQQYALHNPRGFAGYDRDHWGISASDGPGPAERVIAGRPLRFFGYKARGVPYGPDDGTISPWAVAASLPFAPEIVLPALQRFDELKLREGNPYGFAASYNPTFRVPGSKAGWVSRWHFGINQGPIVAMVENARSGLIWRLLRRCPVFIRGLRRAGFTGGWLA